MKRVVGLLALGLMVALSCSQNPAQPDAANPAGPSPIATPAASGEVLYNIGDVETSMSLTLQIADRSRFGNVQYSELKTQRGDLRIAEATFGDPYPEQIWVTSEAAAIVGFRDTDAIVVRQRIFLEGQETPIAQQSFVWSGNTSRHEAKVLEVDLVPVLESLTGSVLLHARAEMFWLPDTNATLIDPNATFDSAQRVEKLSNTLRISFRQ